MQQTPYVLILAGGTGTRFWPASREHLPKQFLDITGSGKSLLRQTVDRFLPFVPLDHIYIITHQQYGKLTAETIPEIDEQQIILEPSRNNTAPSIAYGCMRLAAIDPEAVCIVAPADHIITDEFGFLKILDVAVKHATENDSLITLGIEPTRPDTGYGYIEYDKRDDSEVKKVKSFKEKPDTATAQRYIESHSFAWNAGIFIWKLNVILRAYEQHALQIYATLSAGQGAYNTPAEYDFIQQAYPHTEKLAVDYAILERADNVWTIPCDIGWSDLGTWASLFAFSTKDEQHNAQIAKPVHAENAQDNIIFSNKEKLIVLKGLDNFIIVDTDDCLLIYPKSDEQAIKALKEQLRDKGLETYL